MLGGRSVDVLAMTRRLKSLMEQEGLPFNENISQLYNTRLAQELAKWADSKPGGDRLNTALYQAYFVDGKNIGKMDTLLQIVEQTGLPVDEARTILEQGDMREAVDEDWRRSRSMGVTGVPTFVVNNTGIVGAQPYEQLSDFLEHAGASKR